jgi:NAD-dependent oxidoreductase involved in siderophore biosynthesis
VRRSLIGEGRSEGLGSLFIFPASWALSLISSKGPLLWSAVVRDDDRDRHTRDEGNNCTSGCSSTTETSDSRQSRVLSFLVGQFEGRLASHSGDVMINHMLRALIQSEGDGAHQRDTSHWRADTCELSSVDVGLMLNRNATYLSRNRADLQPGRHP